jgi:hypothetical protein
MMVWGSVQYVWDAKVLHAVLEVCCRLSPKLDLARTGYTLKLASMVSTLQAVLSTELVWTRGCLVILQHRTGSTADMHMPQARPVTRIPHRHLRIHQTQPPWAHPGVGRLSNLPCTAQYQMYCSAPAVHTVGGLAYAPHATQAHALINWLEEGPPTATTSPPQTPDTVCHTLEPHRPSLQAYLRLSASRI